MVKRTWTAMDGCLVFDITINREPGDDIPSLANVSCGSLAADGQILTIRRVKPEKPFELKFRSGCYVSGYLFQQTPVHINGVPNTAIFADIHYGTRGKGDDHHFEGIMVACPMRGPVPPGPLPPAPIEPDRPDPAEPVPIISSHSDELFPYVYVRKWPRINSDDLLYGFIRYTSASPPSSTFFDDLAVARNQSREAAQTLSLQFIDGEPPYQGKFVSSIRQIGGPLGDFPEIYWQLPPLGDTPSVWLSKACEQIARLLSRYGLNWDYFSSSTYSSELDSVWQSYFALNVILGYDASMLDESAFTLIVAHLIAVALLPFVQSSEDALSPPSLYTPPSEAQLAALLHASPILSQQVFPLPPAQAPLSSPPAGSLGWIEPYAIGDLQMVRQRLLRYQVGEVARIENIMRGERREVVHKRTHRQLDEQTQTTAGVQTLGNDASDERSNLQEEARKTVAETIETNQYNKFTSSYGPPTQATLDGNWSKTIQPGALPGLDDTTRFARDILNRTINRIKRSVSLTRSSSTMSQTEDSITSLVDNTRGDSNTRGVFRWLNKIYEACVVNYGQRLMMEFMVSNPAAAFIAQEQVLTGQDFIKPKPPALLNIQTFESIEPGNYAKFGAYYGVLDLEPPPLMQRFASAALRNGEEKQIAIPAGYSATTAFVNYTGTPAGLSAPVVLVGQQAVTPTASPSKVVLNNQDDSVPVSVLDYPESLSPPSDPQVQVIVEIACAPTVWLMDQWRIRTYASIMLGYQKQLAAYNGRAEGRSPAAGLTRSPLANRMIEQREIKNACMSLLLERMCMLTGNKTDIAAFASPPAEFDVNEPRFLQFLDEALEWNEMVYSFYASPARSSINASLELESLPGDDDALFSSFLQADQARVLLPVNPAQVMAFLYFYSSGMLWPARDSLTPVFDCDLALVNDLKHAEPDHHMQQPVGPCWEVVIPTSMQVLDDSGSPGLFVEGGSTR